MVQQRELIPADDDAITKATGFVLHYRLGTRPNRAFLFFFSIEKNFRGPVFSFLLLGKFHGPPPVGGALVIFLSKNRQRFLVDKERDKRQKKNRIIFAL